MITRKIRLFILIVLFILNSSNLCAFTYTKGTTNYSYSTQSQPAKNGTYIDSPFNTTVRRLTNYHTDGVPQGAAGLSTGYPTWNPDNYDQTYLLFQIMGSGGGAAGYVVYKTTDWSFYRNLSSILQSWNGQDAEPRWDTSGLHNDRIYYRKNKQLRYYDVDSQVDGLVHDFANDFTESGFYIYNGEEGSPSSDGRYWAFMYRNGSSPYQATRLIIYDLATDTLTYKNITSTPNFVTMSPDGNYILASYHWSGTGNEYDGPHTYNRIFSQNWHVGNNTLHWGWGYLSDGTLVYVWQDYQDWFSYCEPNKSGSVSWIPFFNYALMLDYPGVHWSLMPSSKKGWIFAIINGGNSWSRSQIMAFKLQDNSNSVWRVAFTQDLATSYNHGFGQISRDGLHYYFGADWRQTDNMEVYRVELPTSWYEDLEGMPSDTTAPAAVNNLTATTGINQGQINLSWTAPGDDGNSGTATTYIIKHSSSAITTDAQFNAAIDITGEPSPSGAGTNQAMTVTGLTPGQTYYFAMKTQDEVPNTSGLSNSASAVAKAVSTNNPPVLASIGNKTVAESSTLSFTISATDADGDNLTYSSANLPAGATLNSSTGAFSWTPANSQIGSYTITFSVADVSGASDSEAITITVTVESKDTEPPYVEGLNPAPDEVQVPLDTSITFHIKDKAKGVALNTLSMSVQREGDPAPTDIILNGANQLNAYPNSVTILGTPADYIISYAPPKTKAYKFRYEQLITVNIGASDLAGNSLGAYSYSFTTAMMLRGKNIKVSRK